MGVTYVVVCCLLLFQSHLISMVNSAGFTSIVILKNFDGCDASQKSAIRQGFRDMSKMLLSVGTINWNSRAAKDYFRSSRTNDSLMQAVQDNFDRAADYRLSRLLFLSGGRINVRCDDYRMICDLCDTRQGMFYAYTDKITRDITFCPTYFKLGKLEDIVLLLADDVKARQPLNAYFNRGMIWLRHLMLIPSVGQGVGGRPSLGNIDLVGVKRDPDQTAQLKFAYGSLRAKWLVKVDLQSPTDPVNNVENYAMFALASKSALLASTKFQNSTNPKYSCYDRDDIL